MATITGNAPRRRTPRLLRAALALCLLFPAPLCGFAAEAGARLAVVATIAQIAEPLRRIAGDRAEVSSLMGEGVDPHLYRPTRSDIARLARADAVFWNGLDLEVQLGEALERLAADRPVVALAGALPRDRLIPAGGAGFDPHVWMDPALWRAALRRAVGVLARLDPGGAPRFRANAEAYFRRVAAVEAYAARVLASVPERARLLVTAHDAFGYFGRRFGLEARGVQGISTESEAGLRRIEDLVAELVARAAPAVFVETSAPDRHLRALIEGAAARGHELRLGGRLFSDAMGRAGTYEGTYIGAIDHNATTIARALGGDAPARGHLGRLGRGG